MTRDRRLLHWVFLACLVPAGCAGVWSQRLTLPGGHVVVREQLVIHSDFPVASHHRLLEELLARRHDITQRLGLPSSDEPIHVYLFQNADHFGAFVRLHHPEFPLRRAFFLETDTRLQVYAQWGDRVAEDLRHEVTHGYLHAVVPNLPLWLDEGLAEYFEVPRGYRGLNQTQLESLLVRIQGGEWQPDLPRLESLAPSRDLKREDYAESWAWVHFFLESGRVHREVLRSYLRDLRQHGSTEPMSARIGRVLPKSDQHLLEYVQRLAGDSIRASGRSWRSGRVDVPARPRQPERVTVHGASRRGTGPCFRLTSSRPACVHRPKNGPVPGRGRERLPEWNVLPHRRRPLSARREEKGVPQQRT